MSAVDNIASPAAPASQARFLVLMCTHDGQAFLGEQLSSLLRQTHPVHALEVHDWASTDGTVMLLQRFQLECAGKLDVRLTRHPNAPGPCASFMQALCHTLRERDDFDWLLLCDQDDVWHEEKIQAFAQALVEEPDLDLTYSDVQLIDSAGRVLAPVYLGTGGSFGRPLDVHHLSTLFLNTLPGMAMGVSRRFLQRGMPAWELDTWVMHDWALCILAYVTRARVRFIARSLVGYRQHGGNAVGSNGVRRAAGPWRGLWQQARAEAWLAHRQYQACAMLHGLDDWRRLPPNIGRLAVALSVLQGRSLSRPKALKVALVRFLFWPGSMA